MLKIYIKLLVIIPLLFSCTKNSDSKFLEIIIRGQESCIQIIKVNETGKGTFLRGQTKSAYKEGSHEIDVKELSVDFIIKDKEILKFLKKEITRLNNIKKKEYGFVLGGQRYILNINGKEKVDSYGSKSDEIHQILKKIINYLPERMVSNC